MNFENFLFHTKQTKTPKKIIYMNVPHIVHFVWVGEQLGSFPVAKDDPALMKHNVAAVTGKLENKTEKSILRTFHDVGHF